MRDLARPARSAARHEAPAETAAGTASEAACDPAGAVALGPLAGSLGFLLRLAQLKNFDEFFDRLGPESLKPGEFSVLELIDRNPGIRQGVLAQRLRIKRAHMTKLVRGFAGRGLVTRRVPEDDRRALELRLTAAGTALLAAHRGPVLGFDAGPAGPLTPQEHRQLVALLRRYLEIDTEGTQ